MFGPANLSLAYARGSIIACAANSCLKRVLMKTIAIALFAVFAASCGLIDRKIAGYTGYSKICIDGVRYIQFTSGASVKYTKDGRVETCD
jgi:hypothetical protein